MESEIFIDGLKSQVGSGQVLTDPGWVSGGGVQGKF